MAYPHECVVCHTPITYTFALCVKCEGTYGNKATEWPNWLRFLWSDIQRERRDDIKESAHDSLSDWDCL